MVEGRVEEVRKGPEEVSALLMTVMKEKLKTILKYSGVFLLGLLVGAFLIESLEAHVRPLYRKLVMRSHLKIEQEFLASRAVRENRPLEAAFHRWVVVNTEADDGFRVFREQHLDLDDPSLLHPFYMLILDRMSSEDSVKRGSKIVEGDDRGKLAAALDALGQKEAAEIQWHEAQRLMHRNTRKQIKDSIFPMLKYEATSSMRLKAENKVLGNK